MANAMANAMAITKRRKAMARKIKKITIAYIARESGCPMGTQVFTGADADVLAANYQCWHPELAEKSFKVEWT